MRVPAGGVELRFVDEAGVACREPISGCWGVAFERARPVREFASYRGQVNFPGWWWFSRTAEHVGFESWLERDVVMTLDADPGVAAVASQPFWLVWFQGGRSVRHAPDFFARRVDGGAVVVDVREQDRIGAQDAVKFEVTAAACAQVGWEYRRLGALEPVLAANLRWLAGYRHPRYAGGARAGEVAEAFAGPVSLLAGARAGGDPVAVLPVVFHLLWRGILRADLAAAPLGPGSLVWAAGGPW